MAMVYLANWVKLKETAAEYDKDAEDLKTAVHKRAKVFFDS